MNRRREDHEHPKFDPIIPGHQSPLMTTDVARTKYCPVAREKCVADVCMFWKFSTLPTHGGKKGRCGSVLNGIDRKE